MAPLRHADTGEPGQLGNQCGSDFRSARSSGQAESGQVAYEAALASIRESQGANKEKTGKFTEPPGDAKGVFRLSPWVSHTHLFLCIPEVTLG